MARTLVQPADIAAPPRIPLLRDIFNGAVRGDYARRLGVPGAATQIALAFVPGVGTLCALRDALANWGRRDGVGVTLNLLAVVPLFGGFPKTAAVLRTVQHVGRAVHVTRQRRRREWQR
jgi:hypothetical protein